MQDNEDPSTPKAMTSDVMKSGPARAPARAMLRATGLDDDAIANPLVAVVNTWTNVTPCNSQTLNPACAFRRPEPLTQVHAHS